jgi:hypothetical protein
MANMVEPTRRALFFHIAAGSEEVCEEALRYEFLSVSSDIYHTYPSPPY